MPYKDKDGEQNLRQADLTRRNLLAAGAKRFLSRPAANPFAELTVAAIARAAGMSRSTVHRYWSTKEEYLADLTRYLLGDPSIFDADIKTIQDAAEQSEGRPIVDAIMDVASADVGSLQGNDIWRAMEALVIGFLPMRPDLHQIAVAGYIDYDDLTYGWYASVLSRSGRKPRKPFTPRLIGQVLQALVEGAGLRELIDRDAFMRPIAVADPAGSYAYAVAALLSVLTTTNGDDRTVREVLTAFFAEPPAGQTRTPVGAR